MCSLSDLSLLGSTMPARDLSLCMSGRVFWPESGIFQTSRNLSTCRPNITGAHIHSQCSYTPSLIRTAEVTLSVPILNNYAKWSRVASPVSRHCWGTCWQWRPPPQRSIRGTLPPPPTGPPVSAGSSAGLGEGPSLGETHTQCIYTPSSLVLYAYSNNMYIHVCLSSAGLGEDTCTHTLNMWAHTHMEPWDTCSVIPDECVMLTQLLLLTGSTETCGVSAESLCGDNPLHQLRHLTA